jgi:hypothetical protein
MSNRDVIQDTTEELCLPLENCAQVSPHTVPANPAPEPTEASLGEKFSKKKKAHTDKKARVGGQQTTVPVQTPNAMWYFRSHPDHKFWVDVDCIVIEGGPDDGVWFLDPDVEFPDELYYYVKPSLLVRCITSTTPGTEFFYLAKQTPKSPKESTRRILQQAKTEWVKQRWNAAARSYDVEPGSSLHHEPVWAPWTLSELLEKAFGDKFIQTPDHAVIQSIINPESDDE